MSHQPAERGQLSVLQSRQIEDIPYCVVKSIKLDNVTKRGNEIKIVFDTKLEDNVKKLKSAQLVFVFIGGVSEDVATNDFFANICRYIRK